MGRYTRLSLYYPAAYLLSGGLAMLVEPMVAMRLFFCRDPTVYGDVLPRMGGALTFALGVLVVQIIRHDVRVMHTTIIGVRVFLVSVWLWLYATSGDPFFLTLGLMVAFGVVLSVIAKALDRRAQPLEPPARPLG